MASSARHPPTGALVPVNIRQERVAATRDHPVDTRLRLSAEILSAVTNPAPAGTGCWPRAALNPAMTAQ